MTLLAINQKWIAAGGILSRRIFDLKPDEVTYRNERGHLNTISPDGFRAWIGSAGATVSTPNVKG